MGRLGEILKDPSISSVRLVLNPDRIAVAETRRAFTYFGLFGFAVDGIFVNKVLPQELAEGYLKDWFTLQQEQLKLIDQSFLQIKQFRIPLLDEEPIGKRALLNVAVPLFDGQAPDDRLSETRTFTVRRDEDKYRLAFYLPNVSKQDLDVGLKNSELILQTKNYRRVFSLPGSLADRALVGAAFQDDYLTVRFEGS